MRAATAVRSAYVSGQVGVHRWIDHSGRLPIVLSLGHDHSSFLHCRGNSRSEHALLKLGFNYPWSMDSLEA